MAPVVTDLPSLNSIDAELARRDYLEFVQQAWHVVEPASKLVMNWHIEEIARHLMAVTDGTIRQLLMNVPPGHMKSSMVSVFWLPWVWLRRPSWRAVFASYASDLAIRDSVRSRQIIESDWYQSTFRPRWKLSSDQNVKGYFTNTATGSRLALGVNTKATGYRGDALVVDDPLNAKEQNSMTALDDVIFWWDQVFANRLNDSATGARVIIMQRLHEKDLSGHVLETQPGKWDHLMLPTKYDPSRAKETALGTPDPRTEPGELLFPQRFPPEVIAEEEGRLGPVGFAGQHQQEPIPAGGSMFKESDWRIVEAIPANVIQWVRSWDAAGTEGAGDYTAGTKMGKTSDGKYIIVDAKHEQLNSQGVEHLIINTALVDGHHVTIFEEEEGGSSGKAVCNARATKLAGYDYRHARPTGDKETRARPLAAQQQAGNVMLYRDPHTGSPWMRKLMAEFAVFPRGKNDDFVDSASSAFNLLVVAQQARAGKLAGFK
jgi:predicted phage terminase large subunit-like protein